MNQDIFSSPDIYEPPNNYSFKEPLYEDARGFIQRTDKPGAKVDLLFTKKGFMRSGDLHKNIQYDFIFSGKAELWLRMGDQDVKKEYGPNSLIEIPPGTPHLFNFLEDTFMAEWWSGPFQAWYYRPYRQIIEKKIS